jgi:hypothetical protein
MEVAWFAEFSTPRSFGFNHYVHTLEQSQLLYVHALVLCETPVKPSGVSFVRWAKRDALPLAVALPAVIAAWLGHADVAFTMRTYVHSQPDALAEGARSLARIVTLRDNSPGG